MVDQEEIVASIEKYSENEEKVDQKHRQWIYDRSDGKSKDGDTHPPCPLCWPPPCVKVFPGCLEQNTCCEKIGEFGCVDGEKDGQYWRHILMRIGLASNILGFLFTFVACLGISTNYNVIQAVPYSRITIVSYDNPTMGIINIGVALRAVAVSNPLNQTIGEELVIVSGEYCSNKMIVEPERCQECDDVSVSLVATIIMSLITYIPSIATNVLRMYRNYDVNCQKAFGVIVTTFSLITALMTWNGYAKSCLHNFPAGDYAITSDLEHVDYDSPQAFMHLTASVSPGAGLIMIVLATILKIVDITVHCILPTPSITRDHQLQLEYEHRHDE